MSLDLAEQCARRIDAVHAVAGAAPDVAVLVAANAVGVARAHRVEHPAVVRLAAALADIENTDMLSRVLGEQRAGLDDGQPTLVRREAQAVCALEIVGDHAQRVRARVQPVDPRRLLLIAPTALVVGLDAVGGSENQIVPSDLTTTSLGEFGRFPSKLSARTVTSPSSSVRSTHLRRCEQVMRRPSRSRVWPLG